MKNTQDNDGSTLAPVTGSANRGGGRKLLAQADHVCRMVCKLLRDDASPNAATLKAAANVWLDNAEAFAASGGWATGTIAEFCERYKVTESERRALGLQLGALRFRAAVEAFEKSPIGEPSDGVGARVANRKDDQ